MIIPDGFAQVNLRFTGAGFPRPVEVVFGVDNTITPNSAAGIGGQVAAAWTARLRAQTMTAYTLNEILVKLGPNATGAAAVTAVGTAGSQAGATLAPMTAFLIRKNTALGGRHGRGRMYYPALGEAFVNDNGSLAVGVAAASTTAFNNFLADMATVNEPLVLLHADATTPTPVSSLTCQSQVATQRRRNRK